MAEQTDIEVVRRAYDGEEAVLCRREEPDVVLMDVFMPVKSGISAVAGFAIAVRVVLGYPYGCRPYEGACLLLGVSSMLTARFLRKDETAEHD